MIKRMMKLFAIAIIASIFTVSLSAGEKTNTIKELYSKKNELSGKSVKIVGIVSKVTENIMGKNWITVTDGTSFDGKTSIIFTSKTHTAVVGNKVTAKGVLELDLDLGFPGYQYPVIVQNAIIIK